MENIYFADLIFIAKQEIKSLPYFYGARFSAYLRFACKQADINFSDICSAILPFNSGTKPIELGDKLVLRLFLTDLGVDKFALLCEALKKTADTGYFSASSLMLSSVLDPIASSFIDTEKAYRFEPFSLSAVDKEAEALLNLKGFTLDLYTPMRLPLPAGTRKVNAANKEVLCQEDFFYRYPFALLHMLNNLKKLGELPITLAQIEALPEAYDGCCEWFDIKYNQDAPKQLGGIIGKIKYTKSISSKDLALRLTAGQYLGLGRSQRFGLGFYKITELQRYRSIKLPDYSYF